MSERQVRVLVTGGIGSGKSSVGRLLRARGALVIDADAVGHGVLEPGGAAFERVTEQWPSVLVDGLIDRRRLADIVFRDPAALRLLESFTHAAIRRRIDEIIADSPRPVVVVEVPLMTDFMGEGWRRVVVVADRQTRIDRLRARGMDEEDVLRRMALQANREEWLSSADLVVENDGTDADLEAQVDELWQLLVDPESTGPVEQL